LLAKGFIAVQDSQRFRGGKAESLDLYFSYHLDISSLAFPNGEKTWAQSGNCSAGLDGKSSQPAEQFTEADGAAAKSPWDSLRSDNNPYGREHIF
jgi:hypothetical protein